MNLQEQIAIGSQFWIKLMGKQSEIEESKVGDEVKLGMIGNLKAFGRRIDVRFIGTIKK